MFVDGIKMIRKQKSFVISAKIEENMARYSLLYTLNEVKDINIGFIVFNDKI